MQIPVFIILLQSDKNRVQHIEQNLLPALKDANFDDITIINAVEGKTYDVVWEFISNKMSIDPNYRARSGQIACYQSHLLVWREAIRRGINRFAVLEDDCVLSHPELLIPCIEELPSDYDFLWLYTPNHQLKNNNAVQIPNKHYINKSYHQWCTVAYLTNINFVSSILPGLLMMRNNIDNVLCSVLGSRNYKSFSCKSCPFSNGGQLTDKKTGRETANEMGSNIWSTKIIQLVQDTKYELVQSVLHCIDNPLEVQSESNRPIRHWSTKEMLELCRLRFPKIYEIALVNPDNQKLIGLLCILYQYGGQFWPGFSAESACNLSPSTTDLLFAPRDGSIVGWIGEIASCIQHPIWFEILFECFVSGFPEEIVVSKQSLLSKYNIGTPKFSLRFNKD